MPHLPPVRGCCVAIRTRESIGQVIDLETDDANATSVLIQWADADEPQWLPAAKLISGFRRGMDVQDVPRSRIRRSLGAGKVVTAREIGRQHQVLVDFPETGRQVWLPFQNLRRITGPEHRFVTGKFDGSHSAERFRLRNLARAIEMWNENTGSLSHLDIDPLPHQIHLVHHILASGNLNWLIADDVGLGKTIEVGMLISALDQRGLFNRILVVTPAGLVKQWQDEFRFKFHIDDFRIYGRDFEIRESYQWKLYDRVIASMDRLKTEDHVESVMQAEPWDLIIFDEAHRLSRRQWGQKLEAAARFKLAASLRQRTDSMLLLTATPHQGMQDKFQALLELLRPELLPEIQTLSLNPEILREMVFRNQKAYVTDTEGNFIFKGKVTRAIKVPQTSEEQVFDQKLRKYLREGYAAGRQRGRAGRAIGFVMTVYRKLAASSVNAIHRALSRRLVRLEAELEDNAYSPLDSFEVDERYIGEWEEYLETSGEQFFAGELEMLRELLADSAALLAYDGKITHFIDHLITEILAPNPDERVLIFTEYRATQDYLSEALAARFGAEAVNLIHGSLDQQERAAQIAAFEDTGQYLISTEAGGEGINLQRRCHIMVNFDLPWNPMRLVQRVGRLYRYGQQNHVVVFNVHSPQTIDAEIINTMYMRIAQVVQDMANVSTEFRSGLEDDILGQVAESMDVESILEDAFEAGVKRTVEEIERALELARRASELQRELFKNFAGFDPGETQDDLAITLDHVQSFFLGMCQLLEVEITETQFGGQVLNLRLPDGIRTALSSSRSRLRVTFDREIAQTRTGIEMVDLRLPLLRHMISTAKDYSFGGHAAGVQLLDTRAIATAMLRWQNDQGRRMRQEFAAFVIGADGMLTCNPAEFSDWLLKPVKNAEVSIGRDDAREARSAIYAAMEDRLAQGTNADLHPENRQWISAAWARDHQGLK